MNEFITGSIVAIISFILGLFGNIWYARYQENRQRQIKGLKKHYYNDLNKFVKSLAEQFRGTYNDLGRITTLIRDEKGEPLYSSASDNTNVSWPYFKGGNAPEFTSHFAKQAEECDKCINEVISHNEKLKEFEEELSTLLNKKINLQSIAKRFNSRIPQFLREELCEIVKERKSIKEKGKRSSFLDRPADWGIIKIIDTKGGFVVTTPDKSWIETTSKANATNFGRVLSEILNSEELSVQMRKFFREATKLKAKAQNIARQLNTINRQYSEFGKTLKRKRKCPTCKLIFE